MTNSDFENVIKQAVLSAKEAEYFIAKRKVAHEECLAEYRQIAKKWRS